MVSCTLSGELSVCVSAVEDAAASSLARVFSGVVGETAGVTEGSVSAVMDGEKNGLSLNPDFLIG